MDPGLRGRDIVDHSVGSVDRSMSDLYDSDILAWSEHQAGLVRRVASGAPPNEAPDWANIVEEIESVGRSQLAACKSHLLQALLHMLKARAWPDSRDVRHWLTEARGQRDDARADFTPSMRQHIDIAELHRRAVRRLPPDIDGVSPLPVPDQCPFTLDEMLADA